MKCELLKKYQEIENFAEKGWPSGWSLAIMASNMKANETAASRCVGLTIFALSHKPLLSGSTGWPHWHGSVARKSRREYSRSSRNNCLPITSSKVVPWQMWLTIRHTCSTGSTNLKLTLKSTY